MQRLTGIGVSPGVVVGPRRRPDPARAGAALPDRAGARRPRAARGSSESRGRDRASSCSDIRARVARPARPELASLFDAQLLMLDDPMLVPRAADDRPRAARQRRVGGAAGVRRVQRGVRRGRRSVPARAQGRRRRPRRPAAMNLRQGVATPRDLLRELDESSVLIADELTPSLAAQVDWTQGPRLRHRRRQPHVSHRDPRALARRAGGRRPARRQRAGPAGAAGGHRRQRQRADRRSDDGGARARRASRRRSSAGGRRRGRAAAAGGDRRRRAHPPRRQHRVPRRSGGRALRRRRRHRPVSLGVPAHRAAAATSATRTSSTRSTAACSRAWRPGR